MTYVSVAALLVARAAALLTAAPGDAVFGVAVRRRHCSLPGASRHSVQAFCYQLRCHTNQVVRCVFLAMLFLRRLPL